MNEGPKGGRSLTDRQVRMVAFDHGAPHFPPQDLSFLSKKELATALAGSLEPSPMVLEPVAHPLATVHPPIHPIFACRSLTWFSSMTGALRMPHSKTPDAPSSRALVGKTIHRIVF